MVHKEKVNNLIWPVVLLAPREKVGGVSKNHAGKLKGASLLVMSVCVPLNHLHAWGSIHFLILKLYLELLLCTKN